MMLKSVGGIALSYYLPSEGNKSALSFKVLFIDDLSTQTWLNFDSGCVWSINHSFGYHYQGGVEI